jgi:ADP-ribose pyrophosphatase
LPNGHKFEAEIVRNPGSVVIIPVTSSGEIILVRQYRARHRTFAWELPAAV